MNRIYKVVWSKVKNCYVVASELAKSHTKAPKSRVFNRSLVAGVLASVLSFSVAPSVFAFEAPHQVASDERVYDWDLNTIDGLVFRVDANDNIIGIGIYNNSESAWAANVSEMRTVGSGGGGTLTGAQIISALGYTPVATDTNTTYSAGDGLNLSGTTFSAKAGTNVTVNSNGISVTGNGSVASGDTGLIDGGKLYAEVRPSDNGNYVKHAKFNIMNFLII